MKRTYWGEFTEKPQNEEELAKKLELDKQVMFEKRSELKILHSSVYFEPKENRIKLQHKNSTVNQIVGLKQKQELIEELIDTSQNDQFTFQQIVPTLQTTLDVFPNRISAPKTLNTLNCFISTVSSEFTHGKPKDIPKVNKKCAEMALKKSICGLVRINDFTEIKDSALQLLADSTEYFYKALMDSIVNVLTNDDRDTETEIDVLTFEKAYFNLTSESSAVFINYFKNEIYNRHQKTASEFTDKVSELKNIVDSQYNLNEFQHADFPSHFYMKEEIKQEFDDYDT